MKISVVDVGSGNLQSLTNALEHLGFSDWQFVRNATELEAVLASTDRLILPGVGNFGHIMQSIAQLGLEAPLRQYIASGKPVMGICVGLQAFFLGSEESPDAAGLGLADLSLVRFDDTQKSVPHIGWNRSWPALATESSSSLYHIDGSAPFYFVNSYAAVVSTSQIADLHAQGWDLALTQYGSQTFVSAISRANVFATQFHPEKSGTTGLAVIEAFLKQTRYTDIGVFGSTKPTSLPTKRVIACLDVRTNDHGDLVVTKGDQYDVRDKADGNNSVRNLGKPVQVAQKYYQQGADEVTFLNITSFRNSPLKDLPMLDVLRLTSKTVFVPLTIGGGIKDTVDPSTGEMVPALEVASLYFRSGADKVSIGSDAVDAAEAYYARGNRGDGTTPIETISRAYGVQAVVISVDPKRVYVQSPANAKHHTFKTSVPGPNGELFVWYQCTVKGGRETRDLGAYELVRACEALGAGEILLNCIDKDGTNSGFDLELVADIKAAVRIPVIASSGAGRPEHFVEVFSKTTADAALGAGMFHRNEYSVGQVKEYMKTQGLDVRL